LDNCLCAGAPAGGVRSLECAGNTATKCVAIGNRRHSFLLIIAGYFVRAAAISVGSLQEFPTYAPTYRFLASCYAHMGRLEEAREIVERLRAFTTGVLESFSYVRNSRHRELFLSGLRLAMGETT
jgi:pentatricopeptide repeat protein